MTLEQEADQKSQGYNTKYSEDGKLKDMLSRPQDFVDGAIENVISLLRRKAYRDGYIIGAKEKGTVWYDIKEKLPPQDEHTCFSKDVMTDTGHWCYYNFMSGEWSWNNRKINVKKWCNFEIPNFEE